MKRTLRRVSWLAAAAMIFLVPGAPATRERSNEIVFVRGVPSTIWVMRADGTHQRLVTSAHSPDSPAWSRDHRWIAFARPDYTRSPVASDIWLIRPDGSGEHQFTHTYPAQAEFPSWSPDGSRIAFDRIGVGIWVAKLDGSGSKAITKQADSDDYHPAWSPDGKHIAFVRQFRTRPGALYVVDADGGSARRLIKPPKRSDNDERPSWSPDGTRIAFERHLNTTPPGAHGFTGTTDVWVAGSDGRRAHLLVRSAGGPTWSPDGNWIVFVSDRGGHLPGAAVGGTPSLYKIHPDGTDMRRLTRDRRGDEDPAW
jgi:TolB protein